MAHQSYVHINKVISVINSIQYTVFLYINSTYIFLQFQNV